LSNSVHKDSWEYASNYVAKHYIDPDVPRESYFNDVKLQMDAKLYAEMFNRHNPPKKVDIFQVSVLEFKDRPGSPLYHLEHFIEGKYTKYNSNSGFVDDSELRHTPQAFSHFTFEFSNHELIVVDIQGVGRLL
jgi:elongation factor 2 kinase